MNLAVFDVIGIIILLAAGVRCAFRGFVAELLSALAVIGGLVGAVLFTSALSPVLAPYIGENIWTPVVAFLLLFLVGYIVVKIVESSLHRLIDRIELEKLDQTLGFVFGLLEGFLFLALLVFILQLQSVVNVDAFFQDSILASFLQKVIPVGARFIEERLQDYSV
jgi:membrane protein required for colicin V production